MPASTNARRQFELLRRRVNACTVCASMDYVHVLGAGNGPLDADVLFIAEAPGRLGAARTGVPLTSDVTGRRFEAFLAAAGIDRARTFVTNALLCNPLSASGNNRPPRSSEVAACNTFLQAQLDLVAAPLVVTLGVKALDALGRIAPHGASLADAVARAIAWRGRTLVPLYHPGIQSTLTRPYEAQLRDWRRLGRLLR